MTLLRAFFPEYFPTYEQFNLVQISDTELLLEMPVPGLTETDVTVETVSNALIVSYNAPKSSREYLHRGATTESFRRKFNLRDDVIVKGAKLKDGLLAISLEIKLPEEKRPRKIPIMH